MEIDLMTSCRAASMNEGEIRLGLMAHGIVGMVLSIVLNGMLHGDSTVEHGINEGRDMQDISNQSQSRQQN